MECSDELPVAFLLLLNLHNLVLARNILLLGVKYGGLVLMHHLPFVSLGIHLRRRNLRVVAGTSHQVYLLHQVLAFLGGDLGQGDSVIIRSLHTTNIGLASEHQLTPHVVLVAAAVEPVQPDVANVSVVVVMQLRAEALLMARQLLLNFV